MNPIQIENCTRVVGASQGYIGLPVRDEQVNCSVNGDGTPMMVTAWRPSPDELAALNAGAVVQVKILGTIHPPIMVGVDPPRQPRTKAYMIGSRYFDKARFEAGSASKAKAMAYRATKEAWGRHITFRDFLDGLSVLHLGPVKEQRT